jgi:predicted XRE-type DNA-binding protein
MSLLRENLKEWVTNLKNDNGVSLRQICNEVDVSIGQMSEFINEKRHSALGLKVISQLSHSKHLQNISHLDAETLLCLLTLWHLTELQSPEKLERHMRMALNVLKAG